MRTIILCLLFSGAALHSAAQLSVSYFPFVSVLQLGTNTNRLLWGDFKVATNTAVSNMDLELSPKCNIHRDDFINFYAGPGVSFNLSYIGSSNSVLNGYFTDFGVRMKPFRKCRSFQVVFEVSPYVNRSFDAGKLRTRLGLSWNFSRRDRKSAVSSQVSEAPISNAPRTDP